MAFDLAAYIRAQKARGYTREQITRYLSGFGYPLAAIQRAFESIEKKGFFARLLSPRVNPEISGYIQQYKTQGYDMARITAYLSQYYDLKDIARAAEAMPSRHVHDISNRALFLGIFIVLGLTLVAAGLFLIKDSPKKLLDYRIELEKRDVRPGEDLYFTNQFINMGSSPKYDIIVRYSIESDTTGEVIEHWGETIGVTGISTSARRVTIPGDAGPGKYRLEGIASYGDETANAFAQFQISPSAPSCKDGIRNQEEEGIDCGGPCRPCAEPSCEDGIRNQGEEGIDCGGPCQPCAEPSCEDGTRNQGEEGIDCGGPCRPCAEPSCEDGIRNQGEEGIDCGGPCPPCAEPDVVPDNRRILEKVRSSGDFNEQESLRLCNTIDDDRIQDDCFMFLAETFSSPMYCDSIQSVPKMNTCYMHFVELKDYSVCPKITYVHMKKLCESLEQIDLLVQEQNISQTMAQ